jgi:DNA repair protein RadC
MYQLSLIDQKDKVEETKVVFDSRPVQKVLRDPKSCTEADLVAALFEKQDTLEPQVKAAKILNQGSLTETPYEELISGIGLTMHETARLIAAVELSKRLSTKAEKEKKVINTPIDVYHLLRDEMAYLEQEHCLALALNIKNRPIDKYTVSIGTLNSSIVAPRDVFKKALRINAASLIVVHNHPSGDPTPSVEDVELTKRLRDAGKILGIEVVDHVIIAKNGFSSLKEKGVI